MNSFELSRKALRDLEGLRRYYQKEAGVRVADKVEESIFQMIADLVRLPMIGHHHPQVRDKSILFCNVYEYSIIFQRRPDVLVLRIIHGRRDIPNRLKSS